MLRFPIEILPWLHYHSPPLFPVIFPFWLSVIQPCQAPPPGRLLAGFEGWLRAVAVHLSSEEERACHAAAAELVAGAVAVLADFDDEDDEEEGEGEG